MAGGRWRGGDAVMHQLLPVVRLRGLSMLQAKPCQAACRAAGEPAKCIPSLHWDISPLLVRLVIT